MKTLTAILFLFISAGAYSQTITTPDSAKYHEGSLTTVCGKVSGTHVGKSGFVKLEFGGKYPDNTFAAIIFPEDTGKFKPALYYTDKDLCITGKVELYKGKAEIKLSSKNQVKEQ